MQIFNISTRYSWLELTAVYIVLFSSLPVLAFSLLDLSTLHSSFPISRLLDFWPLEHVKNQCIALWTLPDTCE
ncbi:hypothetical protein AAZX31_05G230100 [Glycine max]|uniref:Uncharacterized protein n=2 Tax=Glycine subgen. Soja TaxID=1462606 RepID=A0A0R0K0Y8_SOYBN|nr:hypothetical protein JHK87_013815 [Glycine soja]KAG5058921.1 hypothetical protein JHK86_013917 [Glycine max]KAG5155938.1 hypothetical protein JHK82_013907 [Glycine max]KAH1079841.1 hypothetical protein GYH30_056995 [Glycine max]KRH60509.1 hypothetical protein GLYMA_05G244900v4 [Glycine max]